MTWGRPGITGRGWSFLASGAVMAAAAFLFGLEELYALAAASWVLVGAAGTWVAVARADLAVKREVRPGRVPAGGAARVDLMVENRGARTTPVVEAEDPFDGGRHPASFSIAPLRPGEQRATCYRLPASRRGLYRLGPLELHTSDPLGLARASLTTAGHTNLVVHPRHELVPLEALFSHRDAGRHSRRTSLRPTGSDFHTLREYVPGDDLRRVHWPSTARLDDVMVRQFEDMRCERITVGVDLRARVHSPISLEPVLSAAASIVMSAVRAGMSARLMTSAGFDSGHATGRSHGPAVLDALAAAGLDENPDASARFGPIDPTEAVILVSTDLASLEGSGGVFDFAAASLVVVEVATADGGPDGRSSTRPVSTAFRRATVHVAPGSTLASAWTGWQGVRC